MSMFWTAAAPAADMDSLPSVSGTESSSVGVGGDEQVPMLCELVGATQLIIEDGDVDVEELHAYCEVFLGDKRIHKTKVAADGGSNPIWTIDNFSLFLLSVDPTDLSNQSMSFYIWGKGKDSIPNLVKASRIFLGQTRISLKDILKSCNEERIDLHIEDESGEGSGQLGSIAVRFRAATASDIRFLKAINRPTIEQAERNALESFLREEDDAAHRKSVCIVTETDETEVAGASFLKTLSFAFDTTRVLEGNNGIKRVRVKPYHDAKRPEATTYMTSVDLKRETRRPSQEWVQAGSGQYGRLFLEILSCQDLPNVDVGEAVGNVTDSFVCAVFEDAVVQTEVIDDELSPHWLPWTKRAFCFGIMHPASILYLGVFDYDLGPLGHEPIGRVVINVSSLQRDTIYTLKYNLFKSSNVTDRTPQGTITIRLRVEMFDEKAALLSALKPRPKIHVNVKKDKTFRVVRYTCFGEYDGEDKFDLEVVKSYINEIFEYKRLLAYCIGDSVRSLMFWRGQVEVFGVMMPIHSLIFYIMGTTLVERPYLMPSFMILSVAWMMMATSWVRVQHPSPWNRPPSFWHYLSILKNGQSTLAMERIVSKQGAEEAHAYETAWKKRVEDDLKAAMKRAELQQELNHIGDEAIGTEVKGGLSIGLMTRLGRYQGYIGMVCRFFRKIKLVVTWEENILSFWITAVCLGVGLVSLLLPWAFILVWTGRIVMWGFFGPHMKIVDLLLFQNKSTDRDVKKVLVAFKRKFQQARLKREEAVKLKAVKALRFGEYITELPALNLARHYDRPLPQSFARVCRKSPDIDWSDAPRIPAQQLYGVMIPRPENAIKKNEIAIQKENERIHLLETELLSSVDGKRVLKLRNQKPDEEPTNAGYELVESPKNLSPTEDQELYSEEATSNDDVQLSLVPYQNREVVEVSAANSGDLKRPAVFMVTSKTTEAMVRHGDTSAILDEGDEGVEIVACGRSNNSIEDNNNCVSTDSSNAITNSTMSLIERSEEAKGEFIDETKQPYLSVLYRQTETTFVAFYKS